MKKLFLIIACAICATCAIAQNNLQDVVYLKNGSIIRGTIIEQVPGESIKLSTADGSVFTYPMSDVDRMTKEESPIQRVYVSEKSPLAAGLLSFLLSGAGQFYNGENSKGWKYLGWQLGSTLVSAIGYGTMFAGATAENSSTAGLGLLLFLSGGIAGVVNGVGSIVDAVKSANRINVENGFVTLQFEDGTSASFAPMVAYEHPQFSAGMKNEFNAGMKFRLTF